MNQGVKGPDLMKDDLPAALALDVKWCIESDRVGFRVACQDLFNQRYSLECSARGR